MLWPIRRRLLAATRFLFVLALIPAGVFLAWSVSGLPLDVPLAPQLTPLPAPKFGDAYWMVPMLGVCLAFIKASEIMIGLRSQAIAGDRDVIPRAKPLSVPDTASNITSISLLWMLGTSRRFWLGIGFCVSAALLIGLGLLVVAAGLVDFIVSLDGMFVWIGIGAVIVVALVLALIPIAFLRAALRGPRGVVADEYGVSEWSRRGPRRTIAWTDARLLEVWGNADKYTGTVVYRLYAHDGRMLAWIHRAHEPKYVHSHTLVANGPPENTAASSAERAAVILALAAKYTGLAPRTFLQTLADDSAPPSTGNAVAPMQPLWAMSMASGNMGAILGITAGAGLATLSYPTPVTAPLAMVAASTLSLSALWSFGRVVRESISLPRRLCADERPRWQSLASAHLDGRVALRLTRARSAGWITAARLLLLVIGSIAGLVDITTSLIFDHPHAGILRTVELVFWLSAAMFIGSARLIYNRRPHPVALIADAVGMLDQTDASARRIPWTDVQSLRFTWNRQDGFTYAANLRNGLAIRWSSHSPDWQPTSRPESHPEMLYAQDVDGDTFAAIVAERTGLTLAQSIWY